MRSSRDSTSGSSRIWSRLMTIRSSTEAVTTSRRRRLRISDGDARQDRADMVDAPIEYALPRLIDVLGFVRSRFGQAIPTLPS